ncbi:uncharacterized protein CTRU02_201462 [Colletotrichum truncatum]|uniref:Uncharacterized protein n=1 Tax=Colletotrichum truncatum TaxID=5467 RepID=A0ACC3ZHQ2_COLTU|nr:uncharacterized protein CTRU02_14333 [Colletotrichum truncatum]KAF6782294.1 hypothetical protein CTRU02_14333 [Colletotrichum truncatum]
MGFGRSCLDVLDKVAVHTINAVAMNAPNNAGVVVGDLPSGHRPSKNKRDPPPRMSKKTWAETLEEEKAAKEKESQMHVKEL